jgi:hypothetical protein
MDYLHKPRRLLITGKSGTGKSEYFIRYIESVASQYSTVFIFDHEGEFAARTGWPSARSQEDLEQDRHIQVFDPIDLYPGDKETAFEFYCDYVFAYAQSQEDQGKQFLFACDELQKIGGTDVLPQDLSCLVETGRRYCIDTVFIAQQPNLVHNRLRNQVTEVVTFRHNENRAIDWLVQYGFDEDRIRELGSGDFVCRTDRGDEVSGNIFSGARYQTDHPAGGCQDEDESELDSEPAPGETLDTDAASQAAPDGGS